MQRSITSLILPLDRIRIWARRSRDRSLEVHFPGKGEKVRTIVKMCIQILSSIHHGHCTDGHQFITIMKIDINTSANATVVHGYKLKWVTVRADLPGQRYGTVAMGQRGRSFEKNESTTFSPNVFYDSDSNCPKHMFSTRFCQVVIVWSKTKFWPLEILFCSKHVFYALSSIYHRLKQITLVRTIDFGGGGANFKVP